MATLRAADECALQRCIAEAHAKRQAQQVEHAQLQNEAADRAKRDAHQEEQVRRKGKEERRRRFLKHTWQEEEASAWLACEHLCAEAQQQRGGQEHEAWLRVEREWAKAAAARAVYYSYVAWKHAEESAWWACEAPLRATQEGDAESQTKAWRFVELAFAGPQEQRAAHYHQLSLGSSTERAS